MSETKKIRISICLGSSCFSRGNGQNVERLQAFIAEHHLEDKVELVGNLCEGHCENGPNLHIGCDLHHHLTQEELEEILQKIQEQCSK